MSTEKEWLTNLHGKLVVRMVERMMKFRFERIKALKECDFDEEKLADHLNRYAECTALLAIVRAHEGTTGVLQYRGQVLGDHKNAYFRVYELKAGDTLTEENMRDIEAVLAEYNDEIGFQADKEIAARDHAYRDLGGRRAG